MIRPIQGDSTLRFGCDWGDTKNLSHQGTVDFPLHMLTWSREYFEQLDSVTVEDFICELICCISLHRLYTVVPLPIVVGLI